MVLKFEFLALVWILINPKPILDLVMLVRFLQPLIEIEFSAVVPIKVSEGLEFLDLGGILLPLAQQEDLSTREIKRRLLSEEAEGSDVILVDCPHVEGENLPLGSVQIDEHLE